ncbi:MAG: helix-turn-helix transcriptional regulator [Leptospiraceae bacterium]|nr:helix-turn-helix transcriptional regulator [Leptospiraceae bacterium]
MDTENKLTLFFYSLSVIFISISFFDLLYDFRMEGFSLIEALEFILIVAVSITLGLLWIQLWRKYKQEQAIKVRLEQRQQQFRSQFGASLQAMRKAIDDQFDDWHFTKAEQKIARYLIQGHSIQKIAAATNTSPKTIQNHATAIYAKSKTLGRSDLAAWFLQELFEDE